MTPPTTNTELEKAVEEVCRMWGLSSLDICECPQCRVVRAAGNGVLNIGFFMAVIVFAVFYFGTFMVGLVGSSK